MFGPDHYVPILKAKDAEFSALRTLDTQAKASITPLLEVTPPTEKKTWQQHLDALSTKICNSWGTSRSFFVDMPWLEDAPLINGSHPLEYLFLQFRALGCQSIPVTGFNRDAAYQSAVKNCIAADHRGACIRVNGDAIAQVQTANNQVPSLLSQIGVQQQDVDALLDFRAIASGHHLYLLHTCQHVISAFTNLSSARTLSVAASAFPYDLSQLKPNSVTDIDRAEWKLWYLLYQARSSGPRLPTFSDYAIAHPDLPAEVDFPNRSAQIRYTIDNAWRILKGYGVRTVGKGGSRQSVGLCQNLIAMSVFAGRSFSYGDEYIDDCAAGKTGVGNGGTWRTVGTSHHITQVVHQLASLSWP